MNRLAGRAFATILLALFLLAGFGFFIAEYFMESADWAVFSGSPHVYNGGNIGCGVVTDRDGILLLDLSGERTYSSSEDIRKTTVHWVGDRKGSISTPALSQYAAELAGFDVFSGLYSYSEAPAVAKLTLSAQVQTVALEALGNRKGTVAVYNYKTGELLCAVTSPTYDPDFVPELDEDSQGALEGMYVNRFTQSTYIPGSIFKIVTLAAALETDPSVQEQTFSCKGSLTVGNGKVTCEYSHGKQSLKKAFRNSCNCAFAQLAQQLGGETLERYCEQFGVLEAVEFDGITTAAGNIEAAQAAEVDLAWSGIGQHKDQVNPCAFLNFVGAIASGGRGAQPYLVDSVTSGNTQSYEAKTQTGKLRMSQSTAQILQEYMRFNVTDKYGDEKFPGLQVCAKTGTAEVGGEKKPNAMLAGFVEDEQYPLAFIAAVEDAGYGSEVCIPIIAKVLTACTEILQ